MTVERPTQKYLEFPSCLGNNMLLKIVSPKRYLIKKVLACLEMM